MKFLNLFAILASTLLLASCGVEFQSGGQAYGQPQRPNMPQGYPGGYGQQGGRMVTHQGQPQKRLVGYKTIRIKAGTVQAQVKADPSNVFPVARYAASVYQQTGSLPSEAELTARFGFPCRARFLPVGSPVLGGTTVLEGEIKVPLFEDEKQVKPAIDETKVEKPIYDPNTSA